MSSDKIRGNGFKQKQGTVHGGEGEGGEALVALAAQRGCGSSLRSRAVQISLEALDDVGRHLMM